jgi:TRAP-type mannitol/chloroaromatic compound transport system permease large subunit
VIKSVLPENSFSTIYRGVSPYVATDILRLAILVAFPTISMWLPKTMG